MNTSQKVFKAYSKSHSKLSIEFNPFNDNGVWFDDDQENTVFVSDVDLDLDIVVTVQYIGKDDINGEKIFEGHRVSYIDTTYDKNFTGVVEYDEHMCAFVISRSDEGITFFHQAKDIQIVGHNFK
ncbi:YopX family protein [Brevibacillus fortis]|uniref:YopX family protein n=1 Tax=Brevibacillus fortis TaxID=2126352 RepID=UPI002E1A47B9|nr:YopX family protein [Brevibacillus fortis]